MRQPEGCATFLVGAPGFEPGRSKGALCSTGRRGQPYPPDTRNLAESLGIEPSRARALGTLAVCWLTICLTLRWHQGTDSNRESRLWRPLTSSSVTLA